MCGAAAGARGDPPAMAPGPGPLLPPRDPRPPPSRAAAGSVPGEMFIGTKWRGGGGVGGRQSPPPRPQALASIMASIIRALLVMAVVRKMNLHPAGRGPASAPRQPRPRRGAERGLPAEGWAVPWGARDLGTPFPGVSHRRHRAWPPLGFTL